MIIPISQQELEKHLPVAIDPSGNIFSYCESAFFLEENFLIDIFSENLLASIVDKPIAFSVKRYIIAKGFANSIHLLDLTLTQNGFAVTSTEQQAPASKDRVAALRTASYNMAAFALDRVVSAIYANNELFGIWKESGNVYKIIKHFFFSIDDLAYIFPIDKSSFVDNATYFSALDNLDNVVAPFISYDLILHLIDATKENSLSQKEKSLVTLIRKAYAAISQKACVKTSLIPVLNFINANLEDFPAFTNSSEYKSYSNTYENKKDDSIFVF